MSISTSQQMSLVDTNILVVTQIYTFNRKHFEPYQEIQVLSPE